MIESLREEFKRIYKEEARYIFFAPGRINLIGEHTDYNGGMALPAAISLGTYLAVGPNDKSKFVLRSLNVDDYAEILVSPHYRSSNIPWINYPLGVISAFTKENSLPSGLNMLYSGNLPLGGGLSSSASLGMVTAFALNQLFEGRLEKASLVHMVMSAENDFAGVRSGIMDPYVIAFGEKNMALALDCATFSHRPVPCSLGAYSLLMINTQKSRALSESRYNERVAQCRQALEMLRAEAPLAHLCELSPADYEQLSHLITDPVLERRARHVVEENARVYEAIQALHKGDIERLGQLMFDSHASLRELYEVSGREVDLIVEASHFEGVAGARVNGGGFGGSVLALVHQSQLKNYRRHILEEFRRSVAYEPRIFPIRLGEGVRQFWPGEEARQNF